MEISSKILKPSSIPIRPNLKINISSFVKVTNAKTIIDAQAGNVMIVLNVR